MKQRTSQLLLQYWNTVRGDRMAPHRFDIEPAQIAGILPETCILERSANGSCQFRLAGTRICDQFGRELRGVAFERLASEADRPVIEEMFAAITDQGAIGVLELTATDTEGRSLHFEALILPLLHVSGTVSRYLGAISPIKPPAWIGTSPLVPGPLASHELLWADGRPHAVIESTNRQAPFMPAMAGARIVRFDRRQFRVYDGGRKSDV